MARTRSNPSQPNDASQEVRREENSLEQRGAGDPREMGEAQTAGVEEALMERARVLGEFIQGSGLVNGSGYDRGLVNGSGSARTSDEASAPPAPLENCSARA
jgi:hypothetical protein